MLAPTMLMLWRQNFMGGANDFNVCEEAAHLNKSGRPDLATRKTDLDYRSKKSKLDCSTLLKAELNLISNATMRTQQHKEQWQQ